MEQRSWLWWFAAAVAVHAAVGLVLHLAVPLSPTDSVPQPEATLERLIEIDLAPPAASTSGPTPPIQVESEPQQPQHKTSVPRPHASRLPRRPQRPAPMVGGSRLAKGGTQGPDDTDGHLEEESGTGTGHPGNGTGEPTPDANQGGRASAHVDLGLGPGGLWRWMTPGRSSRRSPAGGYSQTGGLQEALDAHDRRLGLGPGGTVATLAHSAMGIPEAPDFGKIVVEVVVGPDGGFRSLRLLSPNVPGVSRVLAALRARLSSRRLPVPPGANRGMAIRIAMIAKSTLPSGASKEHPVQIRGSKAHFDVSDIGRSTVRAVHVRVLSQRRL